MGRPSFLVRAAFLTPAHAELRRPRRLGTGREARRDWRDRDRSAYADHSQRRSRGRGGATAIFPDMSSFSSDNHALRLAAVKRHFRTDWQSTVK
nr:Hypothetical protein SC2p1_01580 [Methylocystis sp. SC2]